jgi:hypothetical protein
MIYMILLKTIKSFESELVKRKLDNSDSVPKKKETNRV